MLPEKWSSEQIKKSVQELENFFHIESNSIEIPPKSGFKRSRNCSTT